MKLGDVDLNNIKVSIFDFDETLAIHKDKDFQNIVVKVRKVLQIGIIMPIKIQTNFMMK